MKRACVIGWPVAHSRSPVIHRYWLKLHGLDGAYELEAVRPEEIEGFLKGLGDRGYAGANVTLPHKEAALAAADRPDQAATTIGAANTLWLDDKGLLHASNTDAYGFMTHLAAEAPEWNKGKRPVVVLGAGGAARAILHGLIEAGATKILLANRTEGRAKALAEGFGASVSVIPWEDRSRALAGCGLLVNATSLGMTGKPALEHRPFRASSRRHRRRHRLQPARNEVARCRQSARQPHCRWPRHAAAPGGAGLRALVRGQAGGDARASRPCRCAS